MIPELNDQNRIVLIGDAANASSPQLGQGANTALISAVVLSQFLDPLKYDNLKNIIIADSPEEFSEAALKLYKNSYNKNEIGQNAREHVMKSYDYKKISKKLVSFFDSIQ